MPITTLKYEPPVRRSGRRPNLDYEHFEAAVALSEEGRPVESLSKVLEHLFPGATIPDLAKEPFTFVQGSSKVTARIEGDDFFVAVPLVKLPAGGGAIAALRHILTQIAATGQLYQPRLRGDDVQLEYRDRLTRMHPAKVVEVFRKMPAEADDNDDFLIGQFQAQPLDRAPVAALDAAELSRAETIWKTHWADVEEMFKECQRKRSVFFLNELTAYAFHRLHFVLPICGFLSSRINDAASVYNDSNEDPMKREASLAKTIKEMKAVTPDVLAKSLGHVEYAISPQRDGSPQVIGGNLGEGDYMERIKDLKSKGQPLDAALALVSTYSFLLARFSWPEAIEEELKAGLAKASGKPLRELANILLEHAEQLAEKYGEDEEEEEDEAEEEEDAS